MLNNSLGTYVWVLRGEMFINYSFLLILLNSGNWFTHWKTSCHEKCLVKNVWGGEKYSKIRQKAGRNVAIIPALDYWCLSVVSHICSLTDRSKQNKGSGDVSGHLLFVECICLYISSSSCKHKDIQIVSSTSDVDSSESFL